MVTKADALQDATLLLIQRHGEGRRDAHLFMRVWGDLKDKYGRMWREHYALLRTDRPVSASTLSRVWKNSGVEADDHRQMKGGVSVIRNEPDEAIVIDVVAPPAPDPGIALDVREALGKLTEAQRYVVEECGLKGRSQADVAAERGVSVQAVKLMYMRARRVLAELLKDYA